MQISAPNYSSWFKLITGRSVATVAVEISYCAASKAQLFPCQALDNACAAQSAGFYSQGIQLLKQGGGEAALPFLRV